MAENGEDDESIDEPELNVIERWFIKAFFDLCRDRQTGMSVGLIPWTAMNEYARRYGINQHPMIIDEESPPIVIGDFFEVIKHLDNEDISRINQKQQRALKRG
jgi:hypothetical protein